jgi:soluble lytic murein transglycosylase
MKNAEEKMGKIEKIQKATTVMALGFILVAFQNWNYIDLHDVSIAPVNEEVRAAHAKELLGRGSRKIGNINDLNQHILDRMTSRLPTDYKKLAPQITKTLIEEAINNNLDPVFVMAVIETESSFNPKARGPFGEIGLMQLKPDTAAWIAKKTALPFKGAKSLEYPSLNIQLGVAYVAYLRDTFGGTAFKYVSAYNMGPRKIRQMVRKKIRPREYATKVIGNYKDFYSEITTGSKKPSAKPVAQASLN